MTSQDISVSVGDYRFQYRVAALIHRGSSFLVCRDVQDGFCYLPGGRVKSGETAAEALVRELREELKLEVTVGRAVFLAETFFKLRGEAFHEL